MMLIVLSSPLTWFFPLPRFGCNALLQIRGIAASIFSFAWELPFDLAISLLIVPHLNERGFTVVSVCVIAP